MISPYQALHWSVAKGCCVASAGTSRIHEWGWRLSVGLAAVPAIVLLIGSLLLPETPNSLIERGHNEKVHSAKQQSFLKRNPECREVAHTF